MVIAGEYVEIEDHPLKKTFPITIDVISAFSKLDLNYFNIASQK